MQIITKGIWLYNIPYYIYSSGMYNYVLKELCEVLGQVVIGQECVIWGALNELPHMT